MPSYPVFYARGDSSSANNPHINVRNLNQAPVRTLEFRPAFPGGDLLLEFNNGAPDPDTIVLVNGVPMTFTVNLSGNLGTQNALSNVGGADLRGKPIVVITLQNGERLWFLTDGSGTLSAMNAFPNGARNLTGLNHGDPVVLICFVAGSLIATPAGERRVEALRPGDLVTTVEGGAARLLWRGERHVGADLLAADPGLRPVRIRRDAFGPGRPHSDLFLSRQHRILLRHWRNELAFGSAAVLVPAKALGAEVPPGDLPAGGVTYHHLLFDRHEIVVSNGLASESFQPSARNLAGMEPAARAALSAALGPGRLSPMLRRPDAFPTVRGHEAAVPRVAAGAREGLALAA